MATAPAYVAESARERLVTLSERLIVTTVWLLALARVITEFLGQTEIVSFGFYTLHIVDLPIAFSFGTAMFCVIRNGFAMRMLIIPAITVTFLISYNLVAGTTINSAPALLWARDFISIGMLLLIAVSANRDIPAAAIRRALLYTAVMLAMLMLLRLATSPNLFMINGWSAAETNDGGRPLSAQGTFMMVLPAVWLWSDALRSPGWRIDLTTICAAVLSVLIIATRQGTASISLIAGLTVIFLLEPGRNRLLRALATVGAGTGIALSAIFVTPLLSDQLNIGQRTANLGTRQAVWSAINSLWPGLPFRVQAFGFPAGQMPVLMVQMNTRYAEWHAGVHSMYYQMLVISGYVGLFSYCILLIGLSIVCLYRTARSQMPAYPLAFCVVTAIFGYSYDVRAEQLVGVLVAIWWTNSFKLVKSS